LAKGEEKVLKGLGAKYGRTLRVRYSRVVLLQKSKRRCPACGALKLKCEASGIWNCSKCGHKIAAGAYDL
jgi:large subunit ribosomal protein L37Ae